MERAGLTSRIFVAVMAGALVALIVGIAWYALSESVLLGVEPALLALAAVALAMVAAGVVTVVLGRSIIDEGRRMVALAQRGQSAPGDDAGAAYEQLASALAERNSQIANLALRGVTAPIDQDARHVAAYVVETARTVSRDATWLLGVITTESQALLPTGVYDADAATEPTPVTDLHRWALSAFIGDGTMPARRIDGPWGAFTAITIEVPGRVAAVLYAPWEGRADPSTAELDLLALVGQHSATALDHALLYARILSQATELDRLAGVQSDFLRSVTHDLQTPLTSIRAMASELHARAAGDEVAQRDLDVIAHQADRLRRMVGQLLIASRLEAGAFQARAEVVRIRPLVERTWSALRSTSHHLEVLEHGPESLAIADPDRLEQVLWALLDNAVKYSPDGSAVDVTIETRAAEPGKTVVTVRDRGIGMDDTTRSRAFEQFYRADEARRLVPDGSGVGLYAARGLIEAMSGEVTAQSRVGHGTEIIIVLPAELVGSDDQDESKGGVGGGPS